MQDNGLSSICLNNFCFLMHSNRHEHIDCRDRMLGSPIFCSAQKEYPSSSLIITDRWMAGSQQMHPLSTKTTSAPIDLDVLVMLKPWRTEMRMAVVNNSGGERERGEQITH